MMNISVEKRPSAKGGFYWMIKVDGVSCSVGSSYGTGGSRCTFATEEQAKDFAKHIEATNNEWNDSDYLDFVEKSQVKTESKDTEIPKETILEFNEQLSALDKVLFNYLKKDNARLPNPITNFHEVKVEKYIKATDVMRELKEKNASALVVELNGIQVFAAMIKENDKMDPMATTAEFYRLVRSADFKERLSEIFGESRAKAMIIEFENLSYKRHNLWKAVILLMKPAKKEQMDMKFHMIFDKSNQRNELKTARLQSRRGMIPSHLDEKNYQIFIKNIKSSLRTTLNSIKDSKVDSVSDFDAAMSKLTQNITEDRINVSGFVYEKRNNSNMNYVSLVKKINYDNDWEVGYAPYMEFALTDESRSKANKLYKELIKQKTTEYIATSGNSELDTDAHKEIYEKATAEMPPNRFKALLKLEGMSIVVVKIEAKDRYYY